MPFQGFEGPAGTGKTHRLTEAVIARLDARPLADHQRVLALTFMHGSRRRLEQRFSTATSLRGRYTCMTIDSFAAHLVHRWRSLTDSHDIHVGDFDQTCDSCGRLLELDQVAKWVAATYPVLVVDEAQELKVQRLRIIRALTPHVDLYVAADEFQCLDEGVDTAPFMAWFHTGHIEFLDQVHRTRQQGLLDAGVALRMGAAVANGPGLLFRYEFPRQMPFAIGHALNRAQRHGGSTALIVAPASRPWADALIPRLAHGLRSANQVVPPLRIGWESRPEDEIESVLRHLEGGTDIPCVELLHRLGELPNRPHWLTLCTDAIVHQRRVKAQDRWTLSALRDLFSRKAAIHRAYGFQHDTGIVALTISGAKNRQFSHVVVLWGPGVPGGPDQQRRLLYNAVTRAERHCSVFVRLEALLAAPPFQPEACVTAV